MKNKREEFIDFKTWCKKHTTNSLYNGIDLAIENYCKSLNSKALDESENVIDNEVKKKSCHCHVLEMGDCDVEYGSKKCNGCKFNY